MVINPPAGGLHGPAEQPYHEVTHSVGSHGALLHAALGDIRGPPRALYSACPHWPAGSSWDKGASRRER